MLGLALVAAIAAMAFMGASSASAKAPHLCKVNETPCAAANQYTYSEAAPLLITSKLKAGTEAQLKGENVPPVKCQNSEVNGEARVKDEARQQITGKITKLKFTNCHVVFIGTSFPCVVTELQLPYTVHLAQKSALAVDQGKGIMHVGPEKQLGGQPGAFIFCDNTFIGDIECTYKSKEIQKTAAEGGTAFEQEPVWIKLEVTGGNPAIVKANQAPLKEPNGGSFACPVQAEWLAEYEVTSPKPVFVSHQS